MDGRTTRRLAALRAALAKETDLKVAEQLRREIALAEATTRMMERMHSDDS